MMKQPLYECINCNATFTLDKIKLFQDVEYFGLHLHVPACPECYSLGRVEDIGFCPCVQPLD